ncbi:MAG: hypothetical protein ACXWF2_09825, partial [Usitatibacter sp.]
MHAVPQKPAPASRARRVNNDRLLADIAAFCQAAGMAESTFGRHVANDGKLVSRLRAGGRLTTQTVERIRSFISAARDGQGTVPAADTDADA